MDDKNGDLSLVNQDIQMGESTRQHQADILMSSPGDWSDSPLTGVGGIDYINENDPSGLLRSVSQQMQKDGMKIIRVGYAIDGVIEIDAHYEADNSKS